ncbi:MAG: ABC transporter substrate-binding protein [Anaerolineales bacterium]|nr:ABC transporter substrate-binding protein [Anaerolineales bacterium]
MPKNRIIIAVAALMLLTGCASQAAEMQETALTTVRITMGYRPDIQFAPLYVSRELGYFEEAGFDVIFEHMAETEAAQLVGAGEIPFAIVSGEQVLLAREQGIPIIYVMAWWQDYPVGIAASADSGIVAPSDLVGRHVGIPGLYGASYIGFEAIMRSAGVPSDSVQLDAIGYSQVEALYQGQEDAIVIYTNNEPVQLRALGMDVVVLRVSDFVHLMGNGLIINEETLQSQPDMVQRMVSAFVRGVEATLDDPQMAYDISTLYVEGLADADMAVQQSILAESLPFWRGDPVGYSDPAAWENMQAVLLSMGYLQTQQDLSDAFTNRFILE